MVADHQLLLAQELKEMRNYFEVGFSLSALVIWLNFFIEKLFFSFYGTN